ncbi:MAG: hypothetical protein H6733_00605 [Alphaproteobacteria bacterium]|nr:hypothetical protein [Alphaproteobacteria bacterium]
MKHQLATVSLVLGVLGAPTALAAHPAPPAGVYVDNDSGLEVDVFVDGAWRGSVRANDERTFSTLPGQRSVVVRTHGTNLELFDSRLALSPARSTSVRVLPPVSHLTLVNDGPAPLLVDLSTTRDDFWLLPGTRRTLDVVPGFTRVTTSVYTLHGMAAVSTYDLRLAAGTSAIQDIGRLPPPPSSHVAFTNYEHTPLRVYVAGREVAVIPPRSTREVDIDAGRVMVTVAQDGGRILYNAPVTFEAASRHVVEVRGGIKVASVERDSRYASATGGGNGYGGRGHDDDHRDGYGHERPVAYSGR